MGSEFPTCRDESQRAVGANSLRRQETVEIRTEFCLGELEQQIGSENGLDLFSGFLFYRI